MKKVFLCMLLCIILVLSFSFDTIVMATELSTNTNEKVLKTTLYQEDSFTFCIKDVSAPDFGITKVYERNDESEGTLSKENLHTIFCAMGMTEEEMSANLETFLPVINKIESIKFTVTYSKHNGLTNKTTYLPEEIALNEITANQNEAKALSGYGFIEEKNGLRSGNPFQDSYMRISVLNGEYVEYGETQYLLSTSATWLTMPQIRMTDGVCIAANYFNLIPGSELAYYSYKQTAINNGNSTTTTIYNSISTTNPINGSWIGTAAQFSLPRDTYDAQADCGFSNSDVFAFVSCRMVPAFQNLTSTNTKGSYAHSKITIALSVGLSLNGSGTISFNGVGITNQEIREAITCILR